MTSQKYGPADFQADTNCTDEQLARLRAYAALVEKWQPKINLIGPKTLPDLWFRHFLDSAQLLRLIPPAARVLVDLGSGAGFPGLVLAAMSELEVHLVDSDQRKAVFLREAARAMGVKAKVHDKRIESVDSFAADVITSRALAPLQDLLSFSTKFSTDGTICLFLKGKKAEDELTAAAKEWTMTADSSASRTDDQASILRLSDVRKRDF